jgi:hypothetical protein
MHKHIFAIKELLAGKSIDYPAPQHVNVTFKKAPKAKGKKANTAELPYAKD